MSHLHRDIHDDDQSVYEYIDSATEYAEQYQNRCLCSSAWEATYDYFPDVFSVPIPPLVSVQEIAYTDSAGDAQVLSSSLYVVDTHSQPGRIALAYGQVWPSIQEKIGCVVVKFTAGYASASVVPARTRQAIRMLVAHWYANRESVVIGQAANVMPMGVAELLDADRLLNYR